MNISPSDRLTRAISLAVIYFVLGGASAAAVAARSPENTASTAAHDSTAAVPAWLRGVWTREWIQMGRAKSNTLDVHYLQTPTFFADIRIPKDRPRFPNAKSFADLTDQQLRLLAGQNGFTGLTTTSGAVTTWNHDIQFQPSDGAADRGRLQRIATARMQEHGLDGSYVESWKSMTGGNEHFLVIRVQHAGRLLRTLVVVGNQFAYARNRAGDLPAAASFDALIDSTRASRAQIEGYLDCEFSVGRVRGGSVPWEIEQSTLPWREARHLDFVDEIAPIQGGVGLAPRAGGDDEWTVPINTLDAREIGELFGGK